MITAVSEATVPKLSVIVRKAYGAGLYAFAGPAFAPDACVALPTARIAVMGPEAAINAVYANKIAAIDDPDERAAFVDERRAEFAADVDLLRLASELVIDAVVEPEDLRADLVARLALAGGKDRDVQRHGSTACRPSERESVEVLDTIYSEFEEPTHMTATDVYYDPYDYAIDADPYPVWRRLRDEAPVYYNEKHDFWALSRYDDVLGGLLDHEYVRVGSRDHARDDHRRALREHPDDDHDGPARAHAAAQARGPGVHAAARSPISSAKIADARERVPRHGRGRGRVRLHRALRRSVAAHRDPGPGRLPRGPRQGVPASSPTRACTSTKGDHHAGRHGIEPPIVDENGEIDNEAFAIIPELMESGARTRRTTCSPVSCTRRSRRTGRPAR